jgi:hypothetical protein
MVIVSRSGVAVRISTCASHNSGWKEREGGMMGEVLLPEGEWRVTDYCLVHAYHINKVNAMLRKLCAYARVVQLIRYNLTCVFSMFELREILLAIRISVIY